MAVETTTTNEQVKPVTSRVFSTKGPLRQQLMIVTSFIVLALVGYVNWWPAMLAFGGVGAVIQITRLIMLLRANRRAGQIPPT